MTLSYPDDVEPLAYLGTRSAPDNPAAPFIAGREDAAALSATGPAHAAFNKLLSLRRGSNRSHAKPARRGRVTRYLFLTAPSNEETGGKAKRGLERNQALRFSTMAHFCCCAREDFQGNHRTWEKIDA
jgi:hypothetical protein